MLWSCEGDDEQVQRYISQYRTVLERLGYHRQSHISTDSAGLFVCLYVCVFVCVFVIVCVCVCV